MRQILSGFLICDCDGRFEAVRGYYVCSTRRKKGPAVCPSEWMFPVNVVERTFLDCLEQVVLTDEFIDRVVDAVFRNDPTVERQALQEERQRLVTEITNLTSVAAAGGMEVPELVKQLQTSAG